MPSSNASFSQIILLQIKLRNSKRREILDCTIEIAT